MEARKACSKFWNLGVRHPTVHVRIFWIFLKFKLKKIIKSKHWILKILKFSKNLKLKQNTYSATGNWVEMKSLSPQTIVHWPDPLLGAINIKKWGWPRISKFGFYDLYECSELTLGHIWHSPSFAGGLSPLWGVNKGDQEFKYTISTIYMSI